MNASINVRLDEHGLVVLEINAARCARVRMTRERAEKLAAELLVAAGVETEDLERDAEGRYVDA